MTGERELSPGELAALADERDFLLKSLDDLEEEHAAGDVDEHDYASLRDDYTARAARVIRTIERHQAREAAPEPGSARWRRVAVAAGVVVFALACGALVAQASGRRAPGDTVTGDIRESSRQRIDAAIVTAREGRYDEAIDLLDEVIEDAPENAEALAFKGWFQFQSGDGLGLTTLIAAGEADPGYPPTHAFMAVILEQAGEDEYARRELAILDGLDPPPYVLDLVEPLRARLAQPAGSTGTTNAGG